MFGNMKSASLSGGRTANEKLSARVEFYNVLNIADRLNIVRRRKGSDGCRKFFFIDRKPASAISLNADQVVTDQVLDSLLFF